MCGLGKALGNVVKGVTKNPIKTIGDVAAVATGNPELIPVINGGTDLAQGKGIGAALTDAGESFAGQEAVGALANQFPGTTGSINDFLGTNISTSGNSLSDLFGATSNAGSFLGPGTIGGDVAGLFSGGVNGIESLFGANAGPVASDTFTSMEPLSFEGSVSPGSNPVFDSADTLGQTGAGGTDFLTGQSVAPTSGTDAIASSFNANVGAFDPTAPGGISATVPASGTGAPAASGFSNFLNHPTFSGALNGIKDNPGAALAGVGLAANAIEGSKMPKGYNELSSEAGQLSNQGAQLQTYLDSGTLPLGAQAGISQATDAAKAAIKSQYASRGMSGSSAEQQDLAAVDSRAQSQGFEMAMNLLQQGVSEQGLATGIYQNLMTTQLKQDEDLTKAFTQFGSAIAGGSPSGTLSLKVQ